ncbi:MAG: cbb3-type cytochrome c oxidase subunit II, partial [Sediminibacterium sp.]|nr:cbb3-type cytochrome c oxidase subunit II [Sediminibacterium sp.]
MNIFNDHKKLYPVAGLLFAFLTFLVVILPALNNQKNNQPLPGTIPLAGDAKNGKLVYIAEGCVGCHSQQVRNVEMDNVFGSRPGMASDYANIGRTSILQNTATLMGTERTGPDLTDIGNRQPSKDWHFIHLFNPRILVQQSIMPAYKWLFEEKEQVNKNELVINVPSQYLSNPNNKIVATQKAIQLVAYIQSLKQVPLPTNIKSNEFLYKSTQAKDKKMQIWRTL